MHVTWLKDFLALAPSCNFSRAAIERHSSQPAFSRRVRALEEWLGISLFERGARSLSLTEAGRRAVETEWAARMEVEAALAAVVMAEEAEEMMTATAHRPCH